MTDDLERLEALARECMKPHGYMTAEDFIAAANPTAILSLIQRVKEADAEIARLNKPIKIYVGSSYVDAAAIRALGGKAG